MALSGRLLTPVIYGTILEALGISPAAQTDPAAALAALTAAAAEDGGPFAVPDVAGASGYATVHLELISSIGRASLLPRIDGL